MKKLIVSLIIFTAIISSSIEAYADMISPRLYSSRDMWINKQGEEVSGPKREKRTGVIIPDKFRSDKNGLWGYKTKETIIEPQFEIAEWFNAAGWASVRKDGKWGVIDTKGNWLIEPKYDYVSNYSEDLAAACEKDECGFINRQGNWVIKSPSIELICVYKDRNNKYNTQYRCFDRSYFADGLAPVEYDKEYYIHVIDSDNNIRKEYEAVFPPNYQSNINPVYGKIKDNKFIVVTSNPTEEEKKSLTQGSRYYKTKKGYINKNGEIVIKGNYVTIKPFSEGLAAVDIGDENYGYINTKGEWVIKPQYTDANDFKNGIAYVKKYDPQVRIEKQKEWEQGLKKFKIKQEKENTINKSNINYSKAAFADNVNVDPSIRRLTAQIPKLDEPEVKSETPERHIKRIDNNTNDNKGQNSIPLMSILLLALIFIAGKSIKKEIKNNNDKSDK